VNARKPTSDQPNSSRASAHEQRRRRRELDVAALEMQAGDSVVKLVTVPAVASGDCELQRALQRDDDEDRPGREGRRRLLCGPERHGPPA
jgi:hypothetical protein